MRVEIHYVINTADATHVDACFEIKRSEYAEMFYAPVMIIVPNDDTRILRFDVFHQRPSARDLVIAEEASAMLADSQYPDNHLEVEITYTTFDDVDVSDELQYYS